MKDLKGKTAVVTGGASGIGKAMAMSFAAQGMNIVLADIEASALESAAKEIKSPGIEVVTALTDVADLEQIRALADLAYERFGKVNVLCNNAGVAASGLSWESSIEDWKWVIDVDLWGVIYGVHTFIPRMLEQGEPAHIVNTASVAGLLSFPGLCSYNVAKHGVVTLSETLHNELTSVGADIRVSVLCPAAVNTRIPDAGRNRPDRYRNETEKEQTPAQGLMAEAGRQALAAGLAPSEVAAKVLHAIQNDEFYILTHPEVTPAVEKRHRHIVEGKDPAMPSGI